MDKQDQLSDSRIRANNLRNDLENYRQPKEGFLRIYTRFTGVALGEYGKDTGSL